jgi:hypothetical protein
MTKNFEHKIERISGTARQEGGQCPDGPVTLALNAAGRDNWELVSIIANPDGEFFAFFRRMVSFSSSI